MIIYMSKKLLHAQPVVPSIRLGSSVLLKIENLFSCFKFIFHHKSLFPAFPKRDALSWDVCEPAFSTLIAELILYYASDISFYTFWSGVFFSIFLLYFIFYWFSEWSTGRAVRLRPLTLIILWHNQDVRQEIIDGLKLNKKRHRRWPAGKSINASYVINQICCIL